MAGYKIGRLTEDMKRELSDIIRGLKDPRISEMLSVVKVYLSNDMSHCKVYVSAIEGTQKTKESVVGLKNATGYVKRELCSRLKLRKCPDILFVADDSIEYGAQITKMLDSLDIKEDEE